MKTTKLLSTALTGLLAVAPTLHAATIVKWGESGGDTGIVTGNANGSFGTTYSTTYVSPADGTNGYDTGAAGQTREYYGAMDSTSGPFGVNQGGGAGGADVIQMVRNFSGAGGTVTSMIAWEEPDFLTSDRALESFTMEFDTRGGATTASYLIETAAGWYQSDQTFADNNFTTINTAIGDLTWSSYSLFGVTGGGGTADTDNIVSVGAYFTSSIALGGNWTGAKLQYFEVTAVAIPEPSSSALLGLGGVALLLRRRRS